MCGCRCASVDRSAFCQSSRCEPERSTYRGLEAEEDQPHDEHDKVKRERQEGVQERGDEHDGEESTDRPGHNAIDDPAIPSHPGLRDPMQEGREDSEDDDGANELPDAQAHQDDFRCGAHGASSCVRRSLLVVVWYVVKQTDDERVLRNFESPKKGAMTRRFWEEFGTWVSIEMVVYKTPSPITCCFVPPSDHPDVLIL